MPLFRQPRYTRPAIALHWLMAVLIVAAFALGTTMVDLNLSPLKLRLYAYHKWLGVTVVLLLVVRLAWRLGHRPPPLPASVPRWQQHLAGLTHGVLYLLMAVVPVSGWLMSSAKGFQTVYFGVLPLPDLLAKDQALGDLLKAVHDAANDALLVLVVLHAVAALKHHLLDRDDVLSRMLPFIKPRH